MKKNNIKIRKAEEADYPAIDFLYNQTYSLYHKNIPNDYKKPPARTLPKGTFLNMLEDKSNLIIVAEMNKNVAGVLYAIVEEDEGNEWAEPYHRVSIEEITVHPNYMHQGVGTALMIKAENWAKEQGIKDMTSLVFDFNKNAISFYEKNGYKPYSIKMNKKF